MQIDKNQLEEIIRKVIMQQLGNNEFEKDTNASGIISVKGSSVKCERFDSGNPDDEVYLKDVLTLKESPRLGCGFMEVLGNKPFKWTLEYDEVDYIIDGVLEIKTDDGVIRGESGDIIFIPKGSSIYFTTPDDKVRFVYITYPADWNEK